MRGHASVVVDSDLRRGAGVVVDADVVDEAVPEIISGTSIKSSDFKICCYGVIRSPCCAQ